MKAKQQTKEAIPAPRFYPGLTIASELYVGRIRAAFRHNGEWTYGIGDNASIDSFDPELGYRVGPKCIKEADVLYWLDGDKWQPLEAGDA